MYKYYDEYKCMATGLCDTLAPWSWNHSFHIHYWNEKWRCLRIFYHSYLRILRTHIYLLFFTSNRTSKSSNLVISCTLCLPETLKLMGFSNKLVNLPSHTYQAVPFKCTIFPFLDYSYIFYHEESLNLYPIWILRVWFIWNTTLYLVLM